MIGGHRGSTRSVGNRERPRDRRNILHSTSKGGLAHLGYINNHDASCRPGLVRGGIAAKALPVLTRQNRGLDLCEALQYPVTRKQLHRQLGVHWWCVNMSQLLHICDIFEFIWLRAGLAPSLVTLL
jgi:hypothetical protein